MSRNLLAAPSLALLILCFACARNDRETAREKAEQAKIKTKEEARKLTQELKQDAKALDRKFDQALNSRRVQSNGPGEAQEKLRRGEQDLRVAGGQAAVKLDRAAVIAKVKAKLAAAVGLSTVTGIDVDAAGQIVTLRGTVSSPEQKQQAEQAALQVNGVTKVVNDLRVQP